MRATRVNSGSNMSGSDAKTLHVLKLSHGLVRNEALGSSPHAKPAQVTLELIPVALAQITLEVK